MSHTGKCLCGDVSYTINATKDHIGACHCTMCRRWSGGVILTVPVSPDEITFDGADKIKTFTSSDWAERAFCATCGSNMYYRVTAPGPYEGDFHLCAGTLDGSYDLPLKEQLFIDIKPSGYSFSQTTRDMTQAEVEELFGVG